MKAKISRTKRQYLTTRTLERVRNSQQHARRREDLIQRSIEQAETRRSISSVVKIQLIALLSKCVTPNKICGVEDPVERFMEQIRNTQEHFQRNILGDVKAQLSVVLSRNAIPTITSCINETLIIKKLIRHRTSFEDQTQLIVVSNKQGIHVNERARQQARNRMHDISRMMNVRANSSAKPYNREKT
ncbi:hypothetical protein EVAR_71838_1 [Eumeta japonica]|uniref:Uncharacterized protein n=1 Tax=Eumeta variegata TaxID=151549 RepID=A0A4C1SLR6_EUMVA|nr:hypothetical protein EVAR_71838_1 [Eumeta japonica]